MIKSELDFIINVVGADHPKNELNYAIFDFQNNCIYATDTRRLLKLPYDFQELNDKGIVLAHPRILRAISGLLDSHGFEKRLSDSIAIKNNCAYINEAYFSLDHFASKKDLPDFESILDRGRKSRPKKVFLEDMTFYIHNKGIKFDEHYIKPINKYFSFIDNYHDTNTYIHTGETDEPFLIEGRKGKKTIFEYIIMPLAV